VKSSGSDELHGMSIQHRQAGAGDTQEAEAASKHQTTPLASAPGPAAATLGEGIARKRRHSGAPNDSPFWTHVPLLPAGKPAQLGDQHPAISSQAAGTPPVGADSSAAANITGAGGRESAALPEAAASQMWTAAKGDSAAAVAAASTGAVAAFAAATMPTALPMPHADGAPAVSGGHPTAPSTAADAVDPAAMMPPPAPRSFGASEAAEAAVPATAKQQLPMPPPPLDQYAARLLQRKHSTCMKPELPELLRSTQVLDCNVTWPDVAV
jgi:hypothetical protein